MSLLNLDQEALVQILRLIDLTSLGDDDTAEGIRALCKKAFTPYGSVACVCTYPKFSALVKECLKNSSVKIAAVSNFPDGSDDIETASAEITQAIAYGANEIDVVMPWQRFLDGDEAFTLQFIQRCKTTCADKASLKVILETGALETTDNIQRASLIAIKGGADFIKTSTGKIGVGATLHAAEIMLKCIRETKSNTGFKASGGIRTFNDALSYYNLAIEIMGAGWINADHFRLGASSLLDNIITELKAT